jgi:hypothetical protein
MLASVLGWNAELVMACIRSQILKPQASNTPALPSSTMLLLRPDALNTDHAIDAAVSVSVSMSFNTAKIAAHLSSSMDVAGTKGAADKPLAIIFHSASTGCAFK